MSVFYEFKYLYILSYIIYVPLQLYTLFELITNFNYQSYLITIYKLYSIRF